MAPTETALDFPIALRLEGRPVHVVGGGVVSEGRVAHLLEAKANVRVIAPELTAQLTHWAASGTIEWIAREFRPGDLSGARLVFTAVGKPEVTRAAVAEAQREGAWVNAADVPDLCDFHLPSIGRQGLITVAVSTAGAAPGLARHLRIKAMASVHPAHAVLAKLVRRLRRVFPKGPGRKDALEQVIEHGAAELIARRDRPALRALLEQARNQIRGAQG